MISDLRSAGMFSKQMTKKVSVPLMRLLVPSGGGADTLAEAADFVGVSVVPDLVEFRVLSEFPVF